MADLAPGDVFAGHRIEDVAGRGGMGVVYRALQLALDRTVALKLITPALAGDPDFRARFVRESRAAASIEHPNVIPIFSAGDEQDVLYISMRFVDGEDLRALLRREGRLDPRRAARIVAQIGLALDAAHERGLVHRDVKPANVLLTPTDHAYLTDFGLTKRVGEGSTQVSRPGGWVGTLGYVAPEQIRGGRVDARADVYALGAVLYHALTGEPPFSADSDEATMWRHLNDEPPHVDGDVPRGFDPVVRRALAKHPDERYPSAGDLGRAALAAAGEHVDEQPERRVARGPAAPAPAAPLSGDETVVSAGAETAVTTALVPTRHRSRRPLLVAGAVVLVAAVAVAVALAAGGGGGGGGDGGGGSTTPPQTRTEQATAARVVKTIPVVQRPNALVLAGGQIWVGSAQASRLVRVDQKTGRRVGSMALPRGLSSMAVGRGFVWIANQARQTITRVSIRTHKVVGTPYTVAGRPVAIAVTRTAVWVGSRTGARSGQRTQLLLKLDPKTGALLNTIPIPRGVENIAVGLGAVWVTNRFADTVTRVDTGSGHQRLVRVGRDPKGLDTGAGYVWVANEGDGTVSRIDAAGSGASPIDVGLDPRGVAVNRFAVWVSGYNDSELARIDPKNARLAGGHVPTALNPFKLALSGHVLWLIATGDGSVQKVDF